MHNEGMDAFERGVKRSSCPYEAESDEAEEWLAGWDEAESLVTNDADRGDDPEDVE